MKPGPCRSRLAGSLELTIQEDGSEWEIMNRGGERRLGNDVDEMFCDSNSHGVFHLT